MRPFESHSRMGAAAWLAGKSEADNPFREGSLAHVEWLGGHLDAMVESGDLDEVAQECARVYLDETAAEARRSASRLTLDLPSATAVADVIGLPVKKWKGNCFAVSVAALESGILDDFQETHGRLFPAYGMYDGPLSQGRRRFNRHGWLESLEGHVVDPTRWVFTDEYPRLWTGPLDDYDLGGMRLRTATRPSRAPRGDGETIWLGLNDPSDAAGFDRVLGDRMVSATGRISAERLHWVVTAPLETLGEHAVMIVATADRIGKGALVPADTRSWLDFALNGYDPRTMRAGVEKTAPMPRDQAGAATLARSPG